MVGSLEAPPLLDYLLTLRMNLVNEENYFCPYLRNCTEILKYIYLYI